MYVGFTVNNILNLATFENVGGATMLPCAVGIYWQTKGLCVTFWEFVYFSVTVEISGHVFPD